MKKQVAKKQATRKSAAKRATKKLMYEDLSWLSADLEEAPRPRFTLRDLVKPILVGFAILVLILGIIGGVLLFNSDGENQVAFDALGNALLMDFFYDNLPNPGGPNEDYMAPEQIGASYWGVQSNSKWLEDWAMEIIPYFSYEGVVDQTVYPAEIVVMPYQDNDHFHVLGWAMCQLGVTTLNLRYSDPESIRYHDPSALTTLVHELGHIQGVCGNDPRMESANQVATMEVLAAMVNHGNRGAIKPFIGEWRELSLDYLQYYLNKRHVNPRLYDLFLKTFIYRDYAEQSRWDKSQRHWATDRKAYEMIVQNYGAQPYFWAWQGVNTPNNWTDWMPLGTRVNLLPQGWGRPTAMEIQSTSKRLQLDDLRYVLSHIWEVWQEGR